MTNTRQPMTDKQIKAAMAAKPSWCCGDPATCQGSTVPCSLNAVYEADLEVRRQHEAAERLSLGTVH